MAKPRSLAAYCIVILSGAVVIAGHSLYLVGYKVSVTPARFIYESGYCFLFPLVSSAAPMWSGVLRARPQDVSGSSRLQLFENGRLLGPRDSQHVDIRSEGMGHYSHWGEVVYFSTSDNSDPNTNGRAYRAEYRVFIGFGYLVSTWIFIVVALYVKCLLVGGDYPHRRIFLELQLIRVHEKSQLRVFNENVSCPTFNALDIIVLLAFALFSAAVFLARWKLLVPFAFLHEDAATVASFAAAYKNPDAFIEDFSLKEKSYYSFYWALHIPILLVVKKLTGDYGTAYVAMLGPVTMIQMAGWYVLGRRLFRDRYLSFLLALVTIMTVYTPHGDYWGLFADPQPRFLYQALLPWLLVLAFNIRHQYQKWPWAMLCAGFIFYANTVSGLPWGFAIWFGMLFFLPPTWSRKRKLVYMVGMGMIFLTAIAPYTIKYLLTYVERCSGDASQLEFDAAIKTLYSPAGYWSVSEALGQWVQWSNRAFHWLYGILGLVGLCAAWTFRPGLRDICLLLSVWTLAVLIVALGIPCLDQIWASTAGSGRLTLSAIRSTRFVIPMMLTACLLPFAACISCTIQIGLPVLRSICHAAGTALAIGWIVLHPPHLLFEAIRAWEIGALVPPISDSERSTLDALEAVSREVPCGATVLSDFEWRAVRYVAIRPLAFSPSDSDSLYTNKAAFLNYLKLREEFLNISGGPAISPRDRLSMMVGFARKVKADYLLTQSQSSGGNDGGLGLAAIWRNRVAALYRVGP